MKLNFIFKLDQVKDEKTKPEGRIGGENSSIMGRVKTSSKGIAEMCTGQTSSRFM